MFSKTNNDQSFLEKKLWIASLKGSAVQRIFFQNILILAFETIYYCWQYKHVCHYTIFPFLEHYGTCLIQGNRIENDIPTYQLPPIKTRGFLSTIPTFKSFSRFKKVLLEINDEKYLENTKKQTQLDSFLRILSSLVDLSSSGILSLSKLFGRSSFYY